jgi:hypothetical protein
LLVEDLTPCGATAVRVEEDMSGILHEDCAIEVWGV